MPLTKITPWVAAGRLSDVRTERFESIHEPFRVSARKGVASAGKVDLDDVTPEGVVKDPAVDHVPYADAKSPAKTGFALGNSGHFVNRNLDDKRRKAESEHFLVEGDNHL